MADRLEELEGEVAKAIANKDKAIREWDLAEAERDAAREALASAESKLAFLKEKGITVGTLKDGHGERLAYVIERDSELDDTATVIKLTDAEIALASAERREGEAVALLRELEWASNEQDDDGDLEPACPWCGFAKAPMAIHDGECKLAALLAKGPTP